jgi:M6 family metalloprotease-like protein
MMKIHTQFIPLLLAGICTTSSALIVWEGKIVSEWPVQPGTFLLKSQSLPSEGFGFYTRPSGKVNCLTMIVDFEDEPAVITPEEIHDWLNKPGYSTESANGSVRDYYYECSNGALELVNDVVGYYRAEKNRSYYESFPDYTGAGELVEEMIDHFDGEVDFSKYDNDGDGSTESVNIVYAGSGLEWGRGLWPHAGWVDERCDGIRVNYYAMSDMGERLGLYVFCHELGHQIFGWPDLYWFGDYCIMGNRMSDDNPQAVNDFFRADQGWIPATDITPSDNLIFTAVHNGGGYRYVNPSEPEEMFFWSVVRSEGRWSNAHGNGLLVYHFDARISGNRSGNQRTLYVVEADGDNRMANDQWPAPGYAGGDFFNAENNSVFSEESDPASAWGLKIYDISAAGDTMTFKVGTGIVAAGKLRPASGGYRYNRNGVVAHLNLLGRVAGERIHGDAVASGYYIFSRNDCRGSTFLWRSSPCPVFPVR